jgi:acetyl-CoA acetyltransferase
MLTPSNGERDGEVRVRDVFLVGVGATAFGRSGRSAGELGRDALSAAIADAGFTPADVGEVITTTGAAAQALQRGWNAVAAGEHDVVACVGAQGAGSGADRAALLRNRARTAERYMSTSGATLADLARVVAKNRAQGAENPRAPLAARPVDAAEVLGSDVLVAPLLALMVAPPADGAAAVVFAASDRRRRPGPRALRVRASVLVNGRAAHREDALGHAARQAYQAAGLGPEDIDLAEVDDASAAGELIAYEALQFAPEGQGPELLASGFTALGGVLPVNASGGMLSQGEAVGASGLAQVCELAWQLRRDAGRRQVAGARVGLACGAARDDEGAPLVSLTILSAG